MKDRATQQESKVISNIRVGKGYFKITLKSSKIASLALPGQFVEIKVSCGCEPLLRRPFGVHRVRGANIEILYEIIGKGTAILSQKKAGEYLDIIGPLGNGFDCRSPGHQVTLPVRQGGRSSVLAAGGMGVAPLVFLAEELVKSSSHQVTKSPVTVLVGAKTKGQILCEKEFRNLGCDVKIATDDGSKGFKGKITELLKKILPSAISHQPSAIYACGPRPMLKEISRISKQYNIPAQISLEEHMSCGIGACLGCIVNTKNGFKRACKEGPIFNADEIIW